MSYYGRNFKLRWGDDTVFFLTHNNQTVVYDLTVPNRQENGHYVTATNYTYGFTFPFEEEFEVKDYTGWMKVNWWHSIVWTSTYVAAIHLVQHWMRCREKYDLRRVLVMWNIFLAVFSTLGALRTVPEMIHLLYNYGLGFTVCISGKP